MSTASGPNVVIIGGSYAALHAATIVAGIPKVGTITLISQSPVAFFNIGAPKLLTQPNFFPAFLVPVADQLVTNTSSKATLVLGLVNNIDLSAKKILVINQANTMVTYSYDIVIVATGFLTAFAGFGVNNDIAATQTAISNTGQALKTAKTVAVIGGDDYGVQTAGGIAETFLQAKVTFFSLMTAPMIDKGLSAKATKKLNALKVDIINNVKASGDSSTGIVSYPDGTTVQFDIVINCFLNTPNTSFLPTSVLDKSNSVVTRGLQIKGFEDSAFAFGDIVSGSPKTLLDLRMAQSPILQQSLGTVAANFPKSAGNTIPIYKPYKSLTIVPIGAKGGVGKWGIFPIPSFAISLINNYMAGLTQVLFQ